MLLERSTLKIEKASLYHGMILFFMALSIISLPLALLKKINVGGLEFSVSYLFLVGILASVVVHSVLHIRMDLGGRLNLGGAMSVGLLLTVVFFAIVSGIDGKFLTCFLLWTFFTLFGMSFSRNLLAKFGTLIQLVAFVVVVIGLVFYYVNIPLIDLEAIGSDLYFMNDSGHYRAASVFMNPNSFAYYLIFYFCFMLFRNKTWTISGAVGFVLALAALYFSGSRSAFIAFGLLLLVVALQRLRPVERFYAYGALKVMMAVSFALIMLFSGQLFSYDVRLEKWYFALEIFLRQWQFVLGGIPSEIPLEKLGLVFSDNMYLAILFRLGAFGFVYFLLYYIYLIASSVKILASGDLARKPYAAFLVVSSIFMFYSNFLFFFPIVMLHGIAVGVVTSRRNA
jgi:hypothetical protein